MSTAPRLEGREIAWDQAVDVMEGSFAQHHTTNVY
jgi:hypothetical protein